MYKKLIENKKAIFYDLDGTIVDTNFLWLKAMIQILREESASYIQPERFFEIGQSIDVIWTNIVRVESLGPKQMAIDLAARTEKTLIEMLQKPETVLEVIPGFWQLLMYFKLDKQFKVALTTNTSKPVTDAILKKIEATTAFDLILTGDDVKHKKPHPEIYKKALNEFKLKPQEVLVFEDSLSGNKSAAKAGLEMFIIWSNAHPAKIYYNGKVIEFVDDFSVLVGKFDTTFFESMVDSAKRYKEYKIEMGIITKENPTINTTTNTSKHL